MEVLLNKEESFLGLNSSNLIDVIRDRLTKLNTEDAIKNTLRRLPRTAFTSDVHYEYYKQYVVPKISMVGKTYVKKYRWCRGCKEENYKHMKINVSNSYIVIEIIDYSIVLNEKNDPYYYRSEPSQHYYTYVLGLDSNGKLFVNKVDWGIPYSATIEKRKVGSIEIYEFEDKHIMDMLGFDRSTDALEDVIIIEKGRYRVQGEIIANLNSWRFENVNSLDDFRLYLRSSIRILVEEYIGYLAYDRVSQYLVNSGFNISLQRINSRLYIAIVDSHKGGVDRFRRAIAIAADLRDRLGGHNFEAINYGSAAKFRCNDPMVGEIELVVLSDRVPYGRRYGNILIDVKVVEQGRVFDEIMKDVDQQLQRLRPRNYRFMIGNHLIDIERSISGNLSYMPNIQPLILPSRPLTINLNAYYVDSDSVMRISHPEHGVNVVRFARPFVLEIGTTNISQDYPGEVNRILAAKAKKHHATEIIEIR